MRSKRKQVKKIEERQENAYTEGTFKIYKFRGVRWTSEQIDYYVGEIRRLVSLARFMEQRWSGW